MKNSNVTDNEENKLGRKYGEGKINTLLVISSSYGVGISNH